VSKARDDETSTTTQEQRIRAYCDGQGLELVEVVIDNGRSAFKASRANRPGLRRALQLVEAGAADVMVCWKIDRVARNTRDLLNLIHDLKTNGAAFASVTEQFDTSTAFGEVVVTIIGALAQMESQQKSERIESWQDHRRDTLATPTGPRPFGYRRERNALIVDKAEAAVIRQWAKAILAGGSVKALAASSESHRKVGRTFTQRGIVRILTGPTIAALREIDGDAASSTVTRRPDGPRDPNATFVDCSDTWKPILDRPTWEALRDILLDPARRTNPGGGRRWLLPGLISCGRPGCDGKLRAKGHPRGMRYTCYRCDLSIGMADTDEVVEKAVLNSLDQRAWRRLRARGLRPTDRAALERQLAGLAHRFADGELTEAEWDILREGITRRLEQSDMAEPLRLPNVNDPRKEWPTMNLDGRRLLIAAVAPRIVVLPATHRRSFDEARIVFADDAGEASAAS
jgi:DNA invertase Pin-like site-specific DNA recombinase